MALTEAVIKDIHKGAGAYSGHQLSVTELMNNLKWNDIEFDISGYPTADGGNKIIQHCKDILEDPTFQGLQRQLQYAYFAAALDILAALGALPIISNAEFDGSFSLDG
jgi:hypothetical protein